MLARPHGFLCIHARPCRFLFIHARSGCPTWIFTHSCAQWMSPVDLHSLLRINCLMWISVHSCAKPDTRGFLFIPAQWTSPRVKSSYLCPIYGFLLILARWVTHVDFYSFLRVLSISHGFCSFLRAVGVPRGFALTHVH